MRDIQFAVFTDLHHDYIPDGHRRLQTFLTRVKQKQIDFMIGLGDMCYPIEANRVVTEALEATGLPCYYAIGNHDMDQFTREQVLHFLGMKSNYYAFTKGNIKFIVLDACYIKQDDDYIPYYKRNYKKSTGSYPYIPPAELTWLENELNDSSSYFVVLSHHSLANDFANRGVANRAEVRALLEKANENGKRVLLCMNGHDHGDAALTLNGICYYTLNAMSYIWHGQKETYNYSQEIHEKYPGLKDMILYEEGLHALVTITAEGQIIIEGMTGSYQNITPTDVGINNNQWNGVSIEPIVSSMST